MGIRVKISNLAERVGNNTADFTDNLAEQVRGFSCNLWERFPDQITQNKNIASSFTRGFMNNMCQDKTLPPPPDLPFSGGQCSGDRYTVRARWLTDTGSLQRLLTLSVFGPIDSIKTGYEPNFPSQPENGGLFTLTVEAYTQTGEPFTYKNDGPESRDPDNEPTLEIVNIDNPSDNCGNLPIQYPPSTPEPIDYITNITINSEDNSQISYPLEYKPTNNISFPLNFDLGGINVTVDLGGINFNFSLLNLDGLPIPLPSGELNPLPPPADDSNRNFPTSPTPPNTITPYLPKPPNAEDFDSTTTENVEDIEEETETGEIEWVLVDVTTYPTPIKNKIIIMSDSENNTMFAGYLNWTINVNNQEYRLADIPIRKEHNAFIAPKNVQGYRIYAMNGAKLRVTKYVQKQEQS